MELTELEQFLSNICKPTARIAVLGIGNYLQGDDFLGVAIIQNLKEHIQKDSILLLEGEIAPIDFFPRVQEWDPTHLIIIDAAEFQAKPGTFNLIDHEQMARFTLTSHKRALTLFIDLLTVYLPDLEIIILGVQPELIDFKEGLSQSIKQVVQVLSNLLVSVLSKV